MMITVATVRFAYIYYDLELIAELTSAFRNRKEAESWVDDIEARKLETYQQEAGTYYRGTFNLTADDFELDSFSLQDLYLN
jgi:hypothetical protein